MSKFFLKHPTRKDFWCKDAEVEISYEACIELERIESVFQKESSPHHLSTLQLIAKLKQHKKSSWGKYWTISVTAPASFGADSANYASEYSSLEDIKNNLALAFELEKIHKELLALLKITGAPANMYINLSKNPFSKISIWKKPLKENNFDIVSQDNEARFYKSKAYAVFIDNASPGYFSSKKTSYGVGVALSDAQLFDTLTLAQRQKSKMREINCGIVEVDIKFKKIIEHPNQSMNIEKVQSYYDKEAITDFLANHDVEKIKEEIAKSENLAPEEIAKKKNKI